MPFLQLFLPARIAIHEALSRPLPEIRLDLDGTFLAIWSGMKIIDTDPNFPHGEITGAIKDALFETHRELGYGFSEQVCRRALAIVLRAAGFQVGEEVLLVACIRQL